MGQHSRRQAGRKGRRRPAILELAPRSLLLALVAVFAWASVASAAPLPVVNSPFADQPVEPTHFSPKNIGQIAPAQADDFIYGSRWFVTDVRWSSWGGAEATGTGQVTLHPNEAGTSDTAAVTVALTGLQDCAGVAVYSSYALALLPGESQPEGWPAGQSGSFPCVVGGDGFARRTGRRGGCFLGFLHRPLPDPEGMRETYPAFSPPLPGKGSTAFCDLRWTQWGGPVAIGDGLRENLTVEHQLERNWPVTLELMQPVWCPRAAQGSPFNGGGEDAQASWPALAYSVLKLTEYGPPRKPSAKTLSSYGHQGLKGRVYWQRLGSVKPGACGL